MCGVARLGQVRSANRLDNGALQDGLVQVMTPALTRLAVDVKATGREDPLPQPFTAGVRILAGEGPRQLDPAGAA